MQNCTPNREPARSGKPPEACNPMPADVLLIGRDPVVRVYTDEVLQRAGFQVYAMTPWEAKNLVNNGLGMYPLVIFSNTTSPQEAMQIGKQMRRRSPESKLLLILGSDAAPGNLSTFDSILEGLDGPDALVREARRLAASSKWRGAQVNRTVLYA